ncbi:glycosyltransferase family 4 protein [Patescibacteria group bacterium]|nr:glycosyltransferase family 4 protein [Patescibacteria group bacterium]
MIIGIDASRANKKEKTGVEWYSYFLIQEFKKIIPQDIQVILYSPAPLREDLLPLPPNWQVKILHWPFRFWTLIRFSWEMLWHKPDILFVPSHIIPFFPPKRTFTTIHDIGFRRFPEHYSWLQRKLLNFGAKSAKKHAKTILTISEFTKNELIDVYKISEDKIKPIYLGYDNTKYKSLYEQRLPLLIEKYGIKKPYLFYIGRLEKKKNIENMLKAVKEPDIDLVLAGKPGYGYEKIKFAIINRKSAILLGWVPQEDVPALMAGAEIFLYPSLYEGFGIPILEAFACGTPVITSNRASMPEVAGDAALLVNPDNPQEISEAIQKILRNPEIKDNLINRGKERCRQFSWQRCAEETLNVLLQKEA